MDFQKTSRGVISHNVLINYQYIDDGKYVVKNFYYPVEDGMMMLTNTHIIDEDDNIVEVIRYDNDGNIFEHFMKIGFSDYLRSMTGQSIYYFKFKEFDDKNGDEYFYIKCYKKEKSRYLKYYTTIYKNQKFYRHKVYDEDENLISDKIDIAESIVTNGNKNSVKMTMIDGKILYMNKKLFLNGDVKKMYEDCEKVKERINGEILC